MKKDMSIQYNAKLIELEDNLEQLETLDIKTQRFATAVSDIENMVDEAVSKAYGTFSGVDSNVFLEDTLSGVYDQAMRKLDKINSHVVSMYEDYYQIQGEYKDLNKNIKFVDASNIERMSEDVLGLLTRIKESTTIDYNEEKTIVENIYQLVYKTIKLELIYTNHSRLLDTVQSSDTDTSYIVKLIKEEIRSLNSGCEKEEVMNRVSKLEKKGFNDQYFLDKDLIILLSLIGNDDLTAEVKNRFLSQVDQYIDTSCELENMDADHTRLGERLREIKKENRSILFRKFRKQLFFLINLGVVSSAIVAGSMFLKDFVKGKEYKTITTTYDSSLDEQEEPIEEYLPKTEDSVTLIEYSPWEEPGYFRDEYKRTVYTYDLSLLDESYDNVEDYLNSDLKDDITFSEEEETRPDDPKEDYSKNKYVITKVSQDENISQPVDRPVLWGLSTLVLTIGTLAVDLGLMTKFSRTTFKDLKEQKRENKKEYANKQQVLLETKTHMDELTNQLFTMKDSIEEEYVELPSALKNDRKIKEKMLVLDNGSKEK